MNLPRFFDRAADAAVGLGVGFTRSTLAERLAETTVALTAPPDLLDHPAHEAGFLFAADLAARLYPRIALAGPETSTKAASARILEINPGCEVNSEKEARLVSGVVSQVRRGSQRHCGLGETFAQGAPGEAHPQADGRIGGPVEESREAHVIFTVAVASRGSQSAVPARRYQAQRSDWSRPWRAKS